MQRHAETADPFTQDGDFHATKMVERSTDRRASVPDLTREAETMRSGVCPRTAGRGQRRGALVLSGKRRAATASRTGGCVSDVRGHVLGGALSHARWHRARSSARHRECGLADSANARVDIKDDGSNTRSGLRRTTTDPRRRRGRDSMSAQRHESRARLAIGHRSRDHRVNLPHSDVGSGSRLGQVEVCRQGRRDRHPTSGGRRGRRARHVSPHRQGLTEAIGITKVELEEIVRRCADHSMATILRSKSGPTVDKVTSRRSDRQTSERADARETGTVKASWSIGASRVSGPARTDHEIGSAIIIPNQGAQPKMNTRDVEIRYEGSEA